MQLSATTTIGLLQALLTASLQAVTGLVVLRQSGYQISLEDATYLLPPRRIAKHTPANVIHDFQSNPWANHSFIIKPGIIRLSLQILIPRIIKCFFASSFFVHPFLLIIRSNKTHLAPIPPRRPTNAIHQPMFPFILPTSGIICHHLHRAYDSRPCLGIRIVLFRFVFWSSRSHHFQSSGQPHRTRGHASTSSTNCPHFSRPLSLEAASIHQAALCLVSNSPTSPSAQGSGSQVPPTKLQKLPICSSSH